MPNSTLPVVFFGTPEFAVPSLAALVAAGFEIRAVVTEAPAPQGRGHTVLAQPIDVWATEHNLPIIRPKKMRDPEFLDQLKQLDCPVFVLAAYGRILPPELLSIPPKGVVNVHPSMLPRYRGPAPIVTALRNGDMQTGVSIMVLDEGMDTGPLLAQASFDINEHDTAQTLSQRLADQGAALLVATLPHYVDGTIQPMPQAPTTEDPTRFITKEDGHIDWRRPAVELERDARAFTPWPALWTTWENQPLKILRARVVAPHSTEPGQVSMVNNEVVVGTGNGGLALQEIQPAGKRAMPAADFVLGHPAFASARLS